MMTPVLVLCILLCAASTVPAEKENLPADVSEPQEEMMRMIIKEEEQELPKDLIPELKDAAEFQQAKGPEGLSLCANGWYLHSGFCYKLFTTSTTWFEAMKTCSSNSASLASTPSSWHYSFLQILSSAGGVGEAWLGGFYVQGIWMWTDELPFSYNGWGFRRRVPENSCVYLRPDAGWENSECSTLKPFICSKRAGC